LQGLHSFLASLPALAAQVAKVVKAASSSEQQVKKQK
jgi:hypothetical protein